MGLPGLKMQLAHLIGRWEMGSYWESPMGNAEANAKLHRIPRFRMGSHHLPVEEGRHFNLPRASRV